MSSGYLIFALNADVDYAQLAYACALSIKITQSRFNKVAIVTNEPDKIKTQYPIFDDVIEYNGPLGMDARAYAFDYTPYENTVLLDSDMLFLRDVSHYWDIVQNRDLFISSCANTYKGDRIHFGHYRSLFIENNMPDIYSAWTYFKKTSSIAIEFFDVAKLITNNPVNFINQLKGAERFTTMPTDEAFSLAIGILDLESAVTDTSWDFPCITHMKGMVQGWDYVPADWTEKIRFSMDPSGQVKLGVWQQSEILHYVDKNLISPTIIRMLETAYGI